MKLITVLLVGIIALYQANGLPVQDTAKPLNPGPDFLQLIGQAAEITKTHPVIRPPIYEAYPFHVIDAPINCPEGQKLDHNGECRDIWRRIRFMNYLNLNVV